jgi:ribosome-associated protein
MPRASREVRVRTNLVIPQGDLDIRFSRSSGPGGQNVNKVESRAEVRFDIAGTTLLAPVEKARALTRLGPRLIGEGVLAVACERTRHRERNLQEALETLGDLLREALRPPRIRRPTKPTGASKRKRVETKRRRGAVKFTRRDQQSEVDEA